MKLSCLKLKIGVSLTRIIKEAWQCDLLFTRTRKWAMDSENLRNSWRRITILRRDSLWLRTSSSKNLWFDSIVHGGILWSRGVMKQRQNWNGNVKLLSFLLNWLNWMRCPYECHMLRLNQNLNKYRRKMLNDWDALSTQGLLFKKWLSSVPA